MRSAEIGQGLVEARAPAATERGLVDRFDTLEMPGDLWDSRPEGIGTLLNPEDRNLENTSSLDENLGVVEEALLVMHQLGKLALDIHDNKNSAFGCQ